jgi:hypothetical protein
VVILSLLKRGEYLSKVTVGRYSCSCPTFVTWVGICPSYNPCDNMTNTPIYIYEGTLHQDTMRVHEDEQIRKVSHKGKGEQIGESIWGMSMSESHMHMRRLE